MDLRALKVGDAERFVAELEPELRAAKTVEDASKLLAAQLYARCMSNGERSLVLSRVYLSLPASGLDADTLRAVTEAGAAPAKTDRFLTLMATHGDEPAWCDRRLSIGHRAIPLNRDTVTQVPMIARCFSQIGFDIELVLGSAEGIVLEGVDRSFGLFHVDEAEGSPFVPAQDFVKGHGVRSVVGCGTMLPTGAVSVWIGFARHTFGPTMSLIPLMPSFWHIVHPLYRRRAFLAS